MQGTVSISYDGIRGTNMNNGIDLYNMSGSTVPGLVEGEGGNRLNVTWVYPGGIVSKTANGDGFWGYAVFKESESKGYSYDSTVYNWLRGQGGPDLIGVTLPISEEDIKAESPNVYNAINTLVSAYVHRLMFDTEEGQMELFKEYFSGCYYSGM